MKKGKARREGRGGVHEERKEEHEEMQGRRGRKRSRKLKVGNEN